MRDLRPFLRRGADEARAMVREGLLAPRAGFLRSAASLARRDAVRASGNIASLAKAAFGREPVADVALGSDTPGARFVAAARFYGHDRASLTLAQDNTHRLFLLYLAAASGILAIDIATWATWTASWIMVPAHVGPILVALILAMRVGFANWQIRRRRLDAIGDYLRRPGEWWTFPATPDPAGKARRSAALVLLLSAATSASILGSPGEAQASAVSENLSVATVAELFQHLSAKDLWYRLLSFVVPGVGPIGGQVTPLANGIAGGFAALSAVLMAMATAVMAYQAVVAQVETAHTGQVLGKRWHQTWSPLRIIYGVAALAPVHHGYCLLQVLVVWCAVASGQIGNRIWSGVVDGLDGASIARPALPETVNVVHDLMLLEVCHATEDRLRSVTGMAAPAWPTAVVGERTGTVLGNLWFQVSSLWSGSQGEPNPGSVNKISWDYGRCGRVTGEYALTATGAAGDLARAQIQAYDDLRASLRPVAQRLVAAVSPGSGLSVSGVDAEFTTLLGAKAAYDNALTAAMSAHVSSTSQTSTSDFKAAAKEAGWVSAGPYYMTIARLNSAQRDAAGRLPNVSFGSNDRTGSRDPLVRQLEDTMTSGVALFREWWGKNVVRPEANLSVAAARAGSVDTGSSVYSALRWVSSPDSGMQKWLMDIVILNPGNMDGLQHMVSLGDYIIGMAEAVLALVIGAQALAPVGLAKAAGAAGSIAAKAFGGMGALGGGLSFASLFVGTVGLALLGAGIFDALVLPMLPFIHFFFATLGILILVVEGVIAAPLWALVHVRMDGQEFVDQRQSPGYQIAFNLLLRIPLTLFGLLFSLVVFNAGVWLLSVTVYPAMVAATADSLFGFVSTVVMLVLVTGLNYQLATRSFRLITEVPDRVSRWFGAGGGDGSESHEGAQVLAMVRGGNNTAVGGMASGAKGLLARRGKNGGNDGRAGPRIPLPPPPRARPAGTPQQPG